MGVRALEAIGAGEELFVHYTNLLVSREGSAPPNGTFSVFTGTGTQAETADDATGAAPATPRPVARVTPPDAAEGAEAGSISPFSLLFNVVAESFCTTGSTPHGRKSKELAGASGCWSW
eukprot:evm.model.NODE_19166_length_72781_cov_34.074345.2